MITRISLLMAMMTIMVLAFSSTAYAADETPPPELDITSGTWHIKIHGLFGDGVRRGKPFTKDLDIYPMLEGAEIKNALATSRTFNTSIHLLEASTVKIDTEAMTIKGDMTFRLTADSWVPRDGQSFMVDISIEGALSPWENEEGRKGIGLKGTYKAVRQDGKEILEGTGSTADGIISGSVGLTETNWGDSVWSSGMSQEYDKTSNTMRDAYAVSLGVKDGKVNWGTFGITAQAKWGTYNPMPIDVSDFGPVDASGRASGTFTVTGRHLHPAGDPSETYTVKLDAYRIQGLMGMKMQITNPDGSTTFAAGRGGGRRGGGGPRDFENGQLWRYEIDNRPWFTEVDGFKPVEPGEHPRLLFRAADVPALRERAKTPEGQAIIARLRTMLGKDGEGITDNFNETPPHNHNKSPKDQAVDTFTSWHAAGFGFLYQLTGEQKYADLAKECVELMFAEKIDRDNRYSWFMPGTDMRLSNVLGAMGYAYDFCYNAWPEDFRQKVALEIQDYNKVMASSKDGWLARKAKAEEAGTEVPPPPKPIGVEKLLMTSNYPPGSNHYGAQIGGVTVALLAITGDPGVNTEWVERMIGYGESNISRLLEYGYGDGGYYAEGFPPSRLSSEGGLIEMIHAIRNVKGRDYVNVDRPHMNAVTMRWIYHVGGSKPLHFPSRGTYGGDELYQKGVRASFAQGFGVIKPEFKKALNWTYQNFFIKNGGDETLWNAGTVPLQAIFAFINWPEGNAVEDPDDVMPSKVLVDTKHGYFCARNRWQDANDIIVTHLIENGPKGYYAAKDGPGHGRNGRMRIWGFGKNLTMDVGANRAPTFFQKGKDGSFLLTAGNPVAVDMSKASGADLVIVAAGVKAKKSKKKKAPKGKPAPVSPFQNLKMVIGEEKINVVVLTMSEGGEKIEATVEGNVITIGGQTFTYENGNLTPKVFDAE